MERGFRCSYGNQAKQPVKTVLTFDICLDKSVRERHKD